MKPIRFVFMTLFTTLAVVVSAEAPAVFWSAEPVAPGETALLQGYQLDAGQTQVTLTAIGNDKSAVVKQRTSDTALSFQIPSDWANGIYRCQIKTAGGTIERLLNQPQPWWFQADCGQTATPGSWFSIFGRCLEMIPGDARVQLRHAGQTVSLTPDIATLWNLTLTLPKDLPTGNWEIHVHNGCGGEDAWQAAGTLAVVDPQPIWKESVFSFADFGGIPNDDLDDSDALDTALAAIEENGGGILRLARGRYRLSRSFELPTRLLLEGAGTASTHLVWADTQSPPEALLSSTEGRLGMRDLSLYAHNYQIGLRVEPPKNAKTPEGDPLHVADVLIERVNVRFTPLAVRLTPEAKAARRELRCEVFHLFADRTTITDCDLVWNSKIGFTAQGRDLVCRRNRCLAMEGGWCPVGGGNRAVVENNHFTGATTGVTRGSQVWFAHNRIEHQYTGFREGFTTDGTFGGPGFLDHVEAEGRHLRFDPKRGRSDPPHIPSILRILEGKGAGLVQRIESFDDDREGFMLRDDLLVAPDDTSILWSANELGRHLFYANNISDTGIALQLYGSAYDCIVANNVSWRSGGFRAKANWTCSNVMFLDNRILEGYGTIGPEANGGESMVDVEGPYVAGFKGVTARGFVIRGNDLRNDSSIRIRGSVHDVVIEHNRIRDSRLGILADQSGRQQGVLVRENTFDNVEIPLKPPQPPTWNVQQ